jgi:hypothetical protein
MEASPIGRANGAGASLTHRNLPPGMSFAPSSMGDGDSIVQHVMVPDYVAQDENFMGEYVMYGGGYFDSAGAFVRPAFDYDVDEVGSQFSVGGVSNMIEESARAWRNEPLHQRPHRGDFEGFEGVDDDEEDDEGRGSSLDSDEQRWLEEQLRGVPVAGSQSLFP